MATVDVSYVPGPLTAVAGDQCWALVEVSPDSPAVSRIWQQLGQGAAVDALLGGLIADGLGGTAGFTLLVAGTGGQHRLFCRGTVGATVVKAAADGGTSPGEGQAAIERIDGAGLLTWREQVVDGADRIFLGEPPADTALRLPATSGVLLAGSVIIDLTNAAARDTVSYEEKPKKKTIVFFPDTITMTHPGRLADRTPAPSMPAGGQGLPGAPGSGAFAAPAPPTVGGPGGPFGGPVPVGVPGAAAGSGHADGRPGDDGEYEFPWDEPARTVADGPIMPAGQDDPVTPGPFPPGGAPVTAGYPGTGGQSPPQYQGTPPPAAQPWQPVPDGAWPGGPRPGAPTTGPVQPPTPMPAAMPAPMPARAANPPGGMPPNGMSPGPAGGLIDAPPWLSGPGGSAPPGQVPPGQAPTPGESGSTVKRAELPDFVAVTAPPDRIGPVVPALLCPSGHVNPPSGATCRRCGAPLPHDPVPVPRPVLGVLRLSLGDVIMLDRGVLMGRNPRTDFAGTDGEERPHVVKLPSADGDISRTHLRVTLDGWHVLVTDLNSTNGTLVTLPGRDPQQLRPGEPVPIQPGTVVTLADGIDFRYEVAE